MTVVLCNRMKFITEHKLILEKNLTKIVQFRYDPKNINKKLCIPPKNHFSEPPSPQKNNIEIQNFELQK